MTCGCSTRGLMDKSSRDQIDEIGDALGLKEIFNQAQEVFTTTATGNMYSQRARRAEDLGFGKKVSNVHKTAAKREFEQAIRQIDATLARIDNRTSQPDWSGILRGTRQAFSDNDGESRVSEFKERLLLILWEKDGLGPHNAVRIRDAADEAFDSLAAEGLEGPMRLIRDALVRHRRGLMDRAESDSRGRTRHEPRVNQAQVDCISVAVAVAAGLFIACIFIPFCMPGGAIAIALFLGLAVGACLTNL